MTGYTQSPKTTMAQKKKNQKSPPTGTPPTAANRSTTNEHVSLYHSLLATPDKSLPQKIIKKSRLERENRVGERNSALLHLYKPISFFISIKRENSARQSVKKECFFFSVLIPPFYYTPLLGSLSVIVCLSNLLIWVCVFLD